MRLGMVSAYPPRRCGTATYAAELGHALSPEFDLVVCALDRYGLSYPAEVAAVIREDERDDYRRAARVLAEHAVDVVLLHYDPLHYDPLHYDPDGEEPDGELDGGSGDDQASLHLLDLVHELGRLNLPYVVILHSLPASPEASRAAAVAVAGAERILVFTERARDAIALPLDRDPSVIEVVPYAVPTVLWHSRRSSGRRRMRERAAMTPRPDVARVLAELGPGPVLTSIGAGPQLATTLAALPAIQAVHPDAQLVTVGDADRDEPRSLTMHLSAAELSALFGRTDVVLTRPLAAPRSWSATLTAAVTAGCPVIAAPHPYADELLATGAGQIVAPDDPAGLTAAVLAQLEPERLAHARAAALARGRRLTWPAVTNRYARILRSAATRHSGQIDTSTVDVRLDRLSRPKPAQSEQWARVAVVGAGLAGLPELARAEGGPRALSWMDTAVTSLAADAAAVDGRPDAVGWALWGLGAVAAGRGVRPDLRERARQLREMVAALTVHPALLASEAYAVLGLTADPILSSSGEAAVRRYAERLDQSWRDAAWPWFGDRLGDGPGARLPHALILAGRRLADDRMLSRGLASLDWYARRSGLGSGSGVLRLPGGVAETAADAGALVEALVEAYTTVGSPQYGRLALTAFGWFHGGNRHATAVYDTQLGLAAPVLRADPGPIDRAATDGTLAYLGALVRLIAAGLVRPAVDTSHRLTPA